MDRSLPQRCSNWSSVPSLTRNLFMASDLAQMDRYGLIICRKDQLFNWLSEFKARAMKRSPGMAYIGTQYKLHTRKSKKHAFPHNPKAPHFGIYIYNMRYVVSLEQIDSMSLPAIFPPNVVAPPGPWTRLLPLGVSTPVIKRIGWLASQPSLGW